jgi:hypothetical protein
MRNAEGGSGRSRPGLRRLGSWALWLVLATAGLLALLHGHATPGTADPLATLKVGHWIQIEGPATDSTASCEELRILTGDFLDDDWSLRGYPQAVDTLKHEIHIGAIRAQVTENTGFDSPRPHFQRLADLNTDLLLEIEGTYLKNRRFLAREVDDESDDRRPWPRNRIRIVGKVERVDSRRRLVTAMGYVFQLTEKTRIRSVIE